MGTQYVPAAINSNGNTFEQILSALPSLHRYVYVLYPYAKWWDIKIADLIHIKPDAVKSALVVESTILTKITDCISKKNK